MCIYFKKIINVTMDWHKKKHKFIGSGMQEYMQQISPPAIACSKLTMETLKQDMKYVQS